MGTVEVRLARASGLLARLACASLAAVALIPAAGMGRMAPAAQATETRGPGGTPSARAHAAFAIFLATYWDPRRRLFVRTSGRPLPGRPARVADLWWQAEAWETVLDAFEAGDPLATPELVGEVFNSEAGPRARADFNDDLGWWALASVRAYELTHDASYLAAARRIAATIWQSWDRSSGGIWWRRSVDDQKNVATNGTATMVFAQLYGLTGVVAYQTRAAATFRWLESHLRRGSHVVDHVTSGGRPVDWQFTYNYGEYLGAAREVSRITGDRSLLDLAANLAHAGMALASGEVLRDEGRGDAGGFKGILVRQLALLAETTGEPRLEAFLDANDEAAWLHRRGDGLSGSSWASAPGRGPIEVLTDLSAVRLFEQLALLSAHRRPAPLARFRLVAT
jgi:predicted alpha-1,6-mannanase (GH76 family)